MAKSFYIPADNSQITVKRFVAFHLAKTDIEKAMVAADAKRKDIEALKLDAILDIIDIFEDSLKVGAPRHEQTFFVNKKRLGFIPDFNELSFKEHVELDTYAQAIFKKDETNFKELPNLLAVMFRPVDKIFGKFYTLREYDSDKVKQYIDEINELTMDRINGALVFFFDYRKRVVEQFAGIFGGTDDDDEDGAYSTPSGLARWGWFHIIESLAGQDITKFDQVLNRPALEVFTHLSYMRDYTAEQKRLYKMNTNV